MAKLELALLVNGYEVGGSVFPTEVHPTSNTVLNRDDIIKYEDFHFEMMSLNFEESRFVLTHYSLADVEWFLENLERYIYTVYYQDGFAFWDEKFLFEVMSELLGTIKLSLQTHIYDVKNGIVSDTVNPLPKSYYDTGFIIAVPACTQQASI